MMSQVIIQAFYETSRVLEYAGNPLIEAMPPILSEEDAAESIASIPPLPGEENAFPKEIRLHCINRISHLIQPFSIHLELEAVISSVIRSGYIGRNPMDAATWRHLHSVRTKSSSTFINSTASTLSLIGLSGMGKTTALKAILKLYPPVIQHTRYHGRDFIHTQIVWLRFDCPNDGSMLGLCQAFFHAVDAALGDNIHASHYRAKRYTPDMLVAMQQVASTYFIGAIFIDELQHLNSADATERENMLNFFVNLINALSVPVIFIGTNPMAKLFADVVRNARRASGQGIYDFKHPEQDDPTWDLLLRTIWEYQWVQRPGELTDDLRNTIYDLTQGVTDFLAKLMILGQRYAIQSNIEQLNAAVLTHVAYTKMKLLLPAIDALRSRDPEKMSKFEDLLPLDEQLDMMMRDDLYVVPNALSVLRAKQQKMLADAAAAKGSLSVGSDEAAVTPSGYILDEVIAAEDMAQGSSPAKEDRVLPISAKILDASQTMEVLAANGWLVTDTFEFEPAYMAA